MVSYIDFLNSEYQRRRASNNRYSLRAFARSLGVNVTSLVKVLKRERHLSLANLRSISAKLNWNARELMQFENEILGIEKSRRANRPRKTSSYVPGQNKDLASTEISKVDVLKQGLKSLSVDESSIHLVQKLMLGPSELQKIADLSQQFQKECASLSEESFTSYYLSIHCFAAKPESKA